MNKLARFIVKFRIIFAVLFVALAAVSIYLMTLVKQNYDMTKYLPSDTETMRGLAIMEKEFGLSNNIMLMVNIDESEVSSIQNKLSDIEGIQLVTLDSYSDGSALFMLTLVGDEYSDGAKATLGRITDFLKAEQFEVEKDAYLGGSLVASNGLEKALKREIPIIMAIAIVIIFLVLLLTSHSWLEPVVFAIVLLCAVLINMGTNVIFGEISYITFAVSAILQMALAMDYSIILLHGYTERQKEGLSKEDALVEALAYNMRPISSSGLTTIAGLIALLFMTFTIGFDIGIVLAKGILISLLSVMLLMPSLILIFSKALQKTSHKPLPLGGEKVASFSLKLRNVLPIVMVVIIAGAYVLQMKNVYSFSGWESSKGQEVIAEHFGNSNQAVVLIDNKYADDDKAQQDFITALLPLKNKDDKDAFKSITSWTTLSIAPSVLAERLNLSSLEIKYSDIVSQYDKNGGDLYNIEITESELGLVLKMLEIDIEPQLIYYMLADESGKVTINSAINNIIDLKNSPLGSFIPISDEALQMLIDIRDNKEKVSAAFDALVSPLIEDLRNKGDDVLNIDEILIRNFCLILFGREQFDVSEFYKMWIEADRSLKNISISKEMLVPLLGEKGVETLSSLNDKFSMAELIEYVKQNEDELRQKIGDRPVDMCLAAYYFGDIYVPQLDETIDNLLMTLRENFVGEEHSRIILLMDMPKDDQATFSLIDTIKVEANKCFGEDNYVAGESMTVKDISEAFKGDLLKINLVTIFSILIIIAVLFRSVLLPVLLVLVIQGAIWITMAIMAIFNIPIFFMSYIICICIQMGATIDYGILISSNFRRNRATMDKREAIIAAVKSAMPTIVTSGLILISAGFIIGFVSSVMPIYSIGRLLGMGTIISIVLILLLLPALLYIFDKAISYTTWDGTRKFVLCKGSLENAESDSVKTETTAEENTVENTVNVESKSIQEEKAGDTQSESIEDKNSGNTQSKQENTDNAGYEEESKNQRKQDA